MRFALLLFILVPIIEMTVLIKVGSHIGALATIGLVLLTAILGVTIIRKQGLETALKAQEKMARGELPASEVAEGIMLIFAGLCLMMPGFITDAIGGLLLIPPLRRLFAAGLVVNFIASMVKKGSRWTSYSRYEYHGQGETIDGEYSKESKDDKDLIDKK
ncbi:phage T7 F exclusion suppressor FxsA [Marinomonas spartinae]|uniref:FxsA family protein n=1 Tax=Marinomonas spartinae TaxID=1792290 RepID=UPI000808EEFB|nr:FxsA family protein [Marinomonas spartinae]SBS37325.1 phage T7 F exclusion suppressor FxsA [Marinomonas spartinae]